MKSMADLDPDEEKLLAEALFETANDDYFEQDVELEGVEEETQQKSSVPNSKIQFPMRRRRSKVYRKLICFMVFLAFVCATLVGISFLLKSKNVSLDLKLAPGETLRYKLDQESIYEGVRRVRSSFSEDVFVHVVNKTGNRYWLEVKINSLPTSGSQKLYFLVRVSIYHQKTIDFGEERFSVFTSRKRSPKIDFYIYNVLCQLIPVVKIDLFEILLSQITTRSHEVTVQDSVLFPGIATMQQNIRTSDQILISSKIYPEGFSAVGASKQRTELPNVEMTFEEDALISRDTGMLKSSDIDLSARVPFGEDFESNSGISMKFKSSLRLVEKIAANPKMESVRSKKNFVPLPRPLSKGAARLRYFPPLEKKYDETYNIFEKVKGMLSLTTFDLHSVSLKKDMSEFSKSFHKIVEPGQEVDFAADDGSSNKAETRGPDDKNQRLDQQQAGKHEGDDGWDDNNDDYQSYEDDDDDRIDDQRDGINHNNKPNDKDRNGDDDDDKWNNRGGLSVPLNPEDSDAIGNEGERYRGPEDEDETSRKQNGNNDDDESVERMADSEIDEPRNNQEIAKDNLKTAYQFEHGTSVFKTPKEKNEPTRKVTNESESKFHGTGTKSQGMLPTKLQQIKTITNTSSTATSSPKHEQSLFSNIFDRLWHDDEDDDDDDDNDSDEDNAFKFPPLIPFSISSRFPFLHLRWPSFDDRKKRRSLEMTTQSRKPRDIGYRDKRRLFGRGPEGVITRPNYTGKDLEMVWDVISYAKINARPKKTTHIFKQRVMGLVVEGDLEHEVLVTRDKKTEWIVNLSLLLNIGEHRFKILGKTYTMEEIKERFIKHSKPKTEYGTVHGGTMKKTMEEMTTLIKAKYPHSSGIVYCLSRNECSRVADNLKAAGIRAVAYHAGLSDQQRVQTQETWIKGRVKVVCATIAFGMGIDKGDVRYVIHYSMPKSLEGYYQECGRAGRDGKLAECILYYSYTDMHRLRRMIDADQTVKDVHMDNLYRVVQFCENQTECRRVQLLHYFGETNYDRAECRKRKDTVCDNCSSTLDYVEKDVTEDAKAFVRTVNEVVHQGNSSWQRPRNLRYPLSHFVDVFKGSNNARVVQEGHERCVLFARGKDYHRNDAERLARMLVTQDVLGEKLVIGNHENVIGYAVIGSKAMQLLNGKFKLPPFLVREKSKPPPKTKKKKETSVDVSSDSVSCTETTGASRNNTCDYGQSPYWKDNETRASTRGGKRKRKPASKRNAKNVLSDNQSDYSSGGYSSSNTLSSFKYNRKRGGATKQPTMKKSTGLGLMAPPRPISRF